MKKTGKRRGGEWLIGVQTQHKYLIFQLNNTMQNKKRRARRVLMTEKPRRRAGVMACMKNG